MIIIQTVFPRVVFSHAQGFILISPLSTTALLQHAHNKLREICSFAGECSEQRSWGRNKFHISPQFLTNFLFKMSLWVDKHRPTSLGKLDYHKEQAANLKKLVSFQFQSIFMIIMNDPRDCALAHTYGFALCSVVLTTNRIWNLSHSFVHNDYS